jgi:hypothetical protein
VPPPPRPPYDPQHPGSPAVPCETCGIPTPMTGTKRCDGCWEVEHRLRDYLRTGGAKARAFVEAALSTTSDWKAVDDDPRWDDPNEMLDDEPSGGPL